LPQSKHTDLTSTLRTLSECTNLANGVERLTINEFVLGDFVPSVPDGSRLLKIVDRVCGRQEHGGPQKETRDRQGQKEQRPD